LEQLDRGRRIRHLLALGIALRSAGRVPFTGADSDDAEDFSKQVRGLWVEAKGLIDDPSFQRLVPPPQGAVRYDDHFSSVRVVVNATRTVDSLVAYLRALVGDPEQEAAQLAVEVEQAKASLELAKGWLATLRGATSYGIQVDDPRLQKLTDSERCLFLDAVTAYDHGAYAAAVCVCGTVAEGIVTRICDSRGLSGESFGKKVKALRDGGMLKEHYDDLAGIVTSYRQRSARPSPEEFNRQKADVVLGSTLILVDELLAQ
jgi:hypothetical protein